MRIEHLKIKIATLTAEARIIRDAERRRLRNAAKLRAKGGDPAKQLGAYRALRAHRRGTLSYHARVNHLAYGFLRGTPYAVMEQRTDCAPRWEAVKKVVDTFAQLPNPGIWTEWLAAAEAHLQAKALAA